MTDKEGVAAVDRALSILEAFREGEDSLPLAQLSERTDLYKSTILRLAASLIRRGYMTVQHDGQYRIGPSVLRLANLYSSSLELKEAVSPALQKLTQESLESASFYVREGDVRVCLYRVDSPRAIRDHIKPGNVLELRKGAGGKVLLAFSGEKGKEFDAIRKEGMVASFGERDSESAAVACPVFGTGSVLVGALSLSGPINRFDKAAVARMKRLLGKVAADLSKELGGPFSGTQ